MNEKEMLPLLPPERFRVTEDAVEVNDAVEAAGMSFAERVTLMTLSGWFVLILFAAAYAAWQEGAHVGAVAVVLAGAAAGVGMATYFWRCERTTLDASGLRRTWIVMGVPAWRWVYPLQRVKEFRVRAHTDGALGGECLSARVVTPAGKLRDVRLDSAYDQRELSEWMAQQLNTVLGRLKTQAGLADVVEDDSKWDISRTPLADTPRESAPQPCRWMLEREPGSVRFWRKAGSWKPMLVSLTLAVVCAALFCFLTTIIDEYDRGGKVNSPAIILVIIAFPMMMIAMPSGLITVIFFFERWAKEHYRLTRRGLEWRRYVLRNGGSSGTLSLDGCAAVEIFACEARRPTVGPWNGWWRMKKVEECRLAFYDAQGKCLAEIVGLSREEALWMRGEFAAFLQAPEVLENKEVAQNAKKKKNPVRNVTAGQDWVACDEKTVEWVALFPVIFIGGMVAWIPFTEDEPQWREFFRRIAETPFSQWDPDFSMSVAGAAVVAMLLLSLFGMFVWFFVGNAVRRDTWRLDADGFRYTFRTLFSRRRMNVPLGRVLGFAVRQREVLSRCREWLVLETAAGVMPLVQDEYDRALEDGPYSAAMRDAAEAGNRALAELKSGLPAESPGQAPAETRWKIIRGEDGGVEFRQMLPFDWGELILPVILVGAGVVGVTVLTSLIRAGLMEDYRNHIVPQPHMLWVMLAFCGMLAVSGVVILIGITLAWRRHRFVAADGESIRTGTVRGKRRWEEVFPRAACMTVENPGLLEPLPQRQEIEMWGPQMQKPPYALVLEDTHGAGHVLAGRLTLEEAEWILGEIGNFCE